MIAKMIVGFFNWLVGKSQVERLLLAATVVAALRMMLIHAVFIGFDLEAWPWFKAVEVGSGLAFAVLEGKALAYVSRLWVGLRPASKTEWVYWGVLALGQAVLLGSIIGVTAFAAASVRRETGVDTLLGDGAAVVWSMFVTSLNPLMVVLIGIARAIDPAERQDATERPVWPPVETQFSLFLSQWQGQMLTPDRAVAEFERLTKITITTRSAERWLAQHRLAQLTARVDDPAAQAVAGEPVTAPDEPASDPPKPTQADIEARRRRVRALAARGKSQRVIAGELGISA